MSDLTLNKVAGAVLATALGVVGLHEVSAMIFAPQEVERPGMIVEVPEEAGGASEPELPPDWGTVLPAADIAAGQTVFAKCQSCHKLTPENGTGPGLVNVVGSRPASNPGFAYSSAMQAYAQEHPQWTFDELNAFLERPQRHIDGTKMTFVGLRNVEERINIIAYLHSLGSSLPIPPPDPSRQPGGAEDASAAPELPEGGEPAEGTAEGAASSPIGPVSTPPAGEGPVTETVPPTGAH